LGRGHRARGTLEIARVDGSSLVTWHPVPDPRWTGATPTRNQVPGSTAFNGGEGVAYFDRVVYFSTKGDDRVWAYDTDTGALGILYDRATAANPILSGVDSVIVCGETTSGCVRASVVDAYSNGFHAVVAEECVFDRSLISHKVNLFDLHHKYADVMHLDEVKGHLQREGMRRAV